MSIPTQTHACAVCLAPAKAGMLMCIKCWRLVPQEQQAEVNSTWRAFEGRKAGDDSKALLGIYRDARTRAINAVRGLRK